MTAADPGELGLGAPRAPDVLAALADYRTLELEREGIAMFLALHDARPGRELVVDDDLARAEAELLEPLFDHYGRALEEAGFPRPADESDEPDETGARELIDVLVVLSDRHLSLRRTLGGGSGDGREDGGGQDGG